MYSHHRWCIPTACEFAIRASIGVHLSPCKANGLTWEDQHPLIGAQHPPIGAKQVWASMDLTHWPGEHVKINNNAKHSQN